MTEATIGQNNTQQARPGMSYDSASNLSKLLKNKIYLIKHIDNF